VRAPERDDEEVRMRGEKRLDVEVVAETVCSRLAELAPWMRRRSRELDDQVERAAMSMMLNIGEQRGNRGGNRRMRIETAAASAAELRRAVRFAKIWHRLDAEVAEEIDRDLDRVCAMLWKMHLRAM
jgi:four helix bundle protein